MEEINEKKTLKKVIALAISIILIIMFFVLKTHKNQNRLLITIGLIFSLLLVLAFALIRGKSNKVQNYYFQAVDFMLMLNSAIIFVQVVFIFLFYPATVAGSSMYPTLVDGDTLIVQSLAKPRNGDIVVVEIQDYNDPLVKRVIGVPGDIFYFTDGMDLILNGKKVEEDYLESSYQSNFGGEFECRASAPCEVPADSYYLMGDNRDWSEDSRKFGYVLKSEILGVVKRRKISLFNWEKL